MFVTAKETVVDLVWNDPAVAEATTVIYVHLDETLCIEVSHVCILLQCW